MRSVSAICISVCHASVDFLSCVSWYTFVKSSSVMELFVIFLRNGVSALQDGYLVSVSWDSCNVIVTAMCAGAYKSMVCAWVICCWIVLLVKK